MSLLLALALATGVASVQAAPAGKTHHKSGKLKAITTEGDIVSVDTAAKTATVKVNGEEMTHPVKGKAVAALSHLKPGDHVHLTVMANAQGVHEYISSIRAATGTPKATPSKKKS
jgi:Cu/Ag efflux protein CusF